MQKIKRTPRPTTFFATLLIMALLTLSGCQQENDDHLRFWTLEKVVYGDGSEKRFPPGSGAGVEFGSTDIIEHHSPTHKQHYTYIFKEDSLELTSQSGETIMWQLKPVDPQTLHVDTPIGTYVLTPPQ